VTAVRTIGLWAGIDLDPAYGAAGSGTVGPARLASERLAAATPCGSRPRSPSPAPTSTWRWTAWRAC
jgi:hypothetical protein